MAGSFHDDWEDEDYVEHLSSHEHDSLCRKIHADRCKGILTNIPEELQHPAWGIIKDSITETLALWQVALLYYPFRDKINTDHPQAFNFKNRRRYVVFDLLDSIYSGGLKLYSIPTSEIESTVHFESSPIEYQVKAKIHVNDLAEAIRNFNVSSVYSKLVKQWRMLAARRSQPTLSFMDAPEAPRVIRCFSYPFGWMRPDENGELRDCIEGIPQSMTYPCPPEIRMMDTKDEWLHHRFSPVRYDENIQISHWFQEQLRDIYADLDKGILSYPLLDTPRYLNNMLETENPQKTLPPTNTPDGLPIPWLMKDAERKPQLPAQMTDAAYRLFRKLNQRNHDSLEDLFNLLTPEYLPDFVAKRNTQTNAYLVELTLTDGRKHNYDNFRKNASKKFI